jgi:hypothetical protein
MFVGKWKALRCSSTAETGLWSPSNQPDTETPAYCKREDAT